MEEFEKLFIELASSFEPIHQAELSSRGLEYTPDNVIMLWKEFDEFIQEGFGTTSLIYAMMKALIDWKIEQLAMDIQILES